jgi:hypothetical protein
LTIDGSGRRRLAIGGPGCVDDDATEGALPMATAMVMQLRRNAGFMFRETGQAMERLGMSMMVRIDPCPQRGWERRR